MKKVRIQNNEVVEIIPDSALPVEKWYGPEFAESCVDAPDEVEQNWVYDPTTQTFYEPVETTPDTADTEKEPTQFDVIEAQVAYTAMMTNTLREV